jgi:predicted kinase
MEVIIFIGIQAAGKSTFYREYFLNTHIRINLDMLKTRHREKILIWACLDAKQSFVVDNTNPTLEDRSRYILPAKEKGFKIIGYYFQTNLEECQRRNNERSPKQVIPLAGILATYKKMILPTWEEGFDEIYSVKSDLNNLFITEEWQREI